MELKVENDEKKVMELTDEQTGEVSGGGQRRTSSSSDPPKKYYCNTCRQEKEFVKTSYGWKCKECNTPLPKNVHILL